MKKILALCLIGLFFTLLGCKKDPPPETPKQPKIQAYSDLSSVPYGKSVVLTLILENVLSVTSELDTTKVTGESKTIEIPSPKLTKTTTYHFLAIGENGLVDIANVTIYVNAQVAPNLTVFVDNDTLFKGKSPNSSIITWTSNTDSTSSPQLSGVKGKSGTISVSPTETTIYHFISKNDGLIVVDSVKITVKDPPPPPPLTREDSLCLHPLRIIGSKYSYNMNGGPYKELDVSAPCKQDNVLTFSLNHILIIDEGKVLCTPGQTNGHFDWTIKNGDNLTIASGFYTILTLNANQLIWRYASGELKYDEVNNTWISVPIWVTETYNFIK